MELFWEMKLSDIKRQLLLLLLLSDVVKNMIQHSMLVLLLFLYEMKVVLRTP